MSGSAGTGRDALAGDVRANVCGIDLIVECKKRKGGAGFQTLERWKGVADLLILERDFGAPIMVIDLTLFGELIGAAIAKNTTRAAEAAV